MNSETKIIGKKTKRKDSSNPKEVKEKPVEKTEFYKDDDIEADQDTPQNQEKKSKWINRQRTMVLSSRKVTHQERHLMKDILNLLPHAKKECKIEKNVAKDELTEVCSNHNCNNCLYFEHRRREFILWLFKNPDGPSIKFQINNIHTLKEIRLTGNCLKFSRPLLSFDSSFDTFPHLKVAKELLISTFNTPNNHPKSKPFYDHVLSFFNVNNTIFFRNYQILNELSQKFCNDDDISKLQLVEIGPRFSMTIIRIFESSLGGKTLFSNPFYISPRDVIKKNYNAFLERKIKQEKKEQELKEITKKNEPKDKEHAWLYN